VTTAPPHVRLCQTDKGMGFEKTNKKILFVSGSAYRTPFAAGTDRGVTTAPRPDPRCRHGERGRKRGRIAGRFAAESPRNRRKNRCAILGKIAAKSQGQSPQNCSGNRCKIAGKSLRNPSCWREPVRVRVGSAGGDNAYWWVKSMQLRIDVGGGLWRRVRENGCG
jgi:hypothetical protein